jgi:hypothetical protein
MFEEASRIAVDLAIKVWLLRYSWCSHKPTDAPLESYDGKALHYSRSRKHLLGPAPGCCLHRRGVFSALRSLAGAQPGGEKSAGTKGAQGL